MRTLCLVTMLIVGGAASDSLAQTPSRFTVGPVARVERVAVEAGLESTMSVFGATAAVQLSKVWGLEGEVTQANGREFVHGYEGILQTFASPNAPIEEIERLGVKARWRYGYRPGIGGSVAVTARGQVNERVDLVLRVGLATRKYRETATISILSIPPGIDPTQVVTVSFGDGTGLSKTNRGGLLFGFDVPLTVTGRLTVSPSLHYVYGGPASIGNKHREISFGVRVAWGMF